MKKVIIYLTADKKNFQTIQPSENFGGDWAGLVFTVTNGNYHSYEVI